MNYTFWKDKRVLLTGHTGFKGSWLSIWLNMLGSKVFGYSLKSPTCPSLFEVASVSDICTSQIGDIRELSLLQSFVDHIKPEIVIHMAAQPIVRESYKVPVDTYAINVMGTVNILETVRKCDSVRSFVNVTTDKVYENKEWIWGYRETEPFGGHDPYSNSKACSELVTSSYRQSFFSPNKYEEHRVAIASARAGNVIGGGDWATDRIIPDCIRAVLKKDTVIIRNPHAIRPWQHVLEPLNGYLTLAEKLFTDGSKYAEGWNFGPSDDDCVSVGELVKMFCNEWAEGAVYEIRSNDGPHEANYLKLDCSKSKQILNWRPIWNLEKAVKAIVYWEKEFQNKADIFKVCEAQIQQFMVDREN